MLQGRIRQDDRILQVQHKDLASFSQSQPKGLVIQRGMVLQLGLRQQPVLESALQQGQELPLPLQQLVAQKLLEFDCLELPKVEEVASRMVLGKSSHQAQKR
jgi:hypothetical protein